jgi:SagB-type dehydrogenase family enzyme
MDKRRPSQPPQKVEMSFDEFVATELPHLADIVTFSNNLPISIYAGSTGVKSPEVVYRGLMLSQNRLSAEEYLLNFKGNDADIGIIIGTNTYNMPAVIGSLAIRDLEEVEDDIIALPPYRLLREPIGSVIRSRRSVRDYSGKPISMEELSTVLFHGNGVSGRLPVENVTETVTLGRPEYVELRTAISGGALYPIKLYILALNVSGLKTGIYRYLPRYHGLKCVVQSSQAFSVSEVAQFGEVRAEKANFLVAYVYRVFDNARKYGESGLAFAFMEVGAIATNIHLTCTALGMGSCDVGSFSKRQIEKLLQVDGMSEHMLHLTVIGK